MYSSTKKWVAVLAVIIIVAAGAGTYFYFKDKDKSSETSTARYHYNYSYSDVQEITLSNGTVKKASDESGATAIRVYNVAFKNDYTSSTTANFSYLKMITKITNPKSGADSQEFKATYITSYYCSSSYVSVYTGMTEYFQLAFYLKDYSAYKTDKSQITVELKYDASSETTNSYYARDTGIGVYSKVLQIRTNPTLTSGTSSITTYDSIEMSDGTIKTAKDGYTYRVYAINVRSFGDSVELNASDAKLHLNVTWASGDSAKGYSVQAVSGYKYSEKVTLDAWSGDETGYKTIKVAFEVPKTATVNTIASTCYIVFDGYESGVVTGNSHLPSPSLTA